jgi:malonyl-CoA/methylmalonyl-CoA synthetase
MTQWERLTGQRLLERYGMTETGMILSNPLEPLDGRTPGAVGTPLPSVRVRLLPAAAERAQQSHEGVTGEVQVKGPTLFSGYYGNESATAAAFDNEGWFLTGDTAIREEASGRYRILGRTSVDIIKCGGHKVRMPMLSIPLSPDAARCARPKSFEVRVWGRLRPGRSFCAHSATRETLSRLSPFTCIWHGPAATQTLTVWA